MASVQEPSTSFVALANQNETLWKEAYEKFKHEDSGLYERLQSIIDKDSNVKNNVGQEQRLGDLLLRKRRVMEDKQWPMGDKAAGLDPVHAGFPWACVSVLLPLILNHPEEQEAALNGLEKVVEIVQQFTSLSWDYLNLSQFKSEKQLKESILTLYWKILRYEATAINNFNRHIIVRYAASIVRKDEWKKLLGEVEDNRNNIMSNLQLNDSQNQKRFETELRELILQLDRTDDKNIEVIQWVSDKPYISQHYTARQLLSQYPYAGEWIIEKYTKWLHHDGAPAFWLRGTIGTGKTSIMSTIIESFYSDVARQDDHRMIYFYCISPTTPDDVIRSLVSQLAWTLDGNAIESSILAMFTDAKPPNATIPMTKEWSAALLKLCQRLSKVIIVIDALDECVDFSKLLATLRQLQVRQLDGIKFVFSSRLNVDVNKVFTASDGVTLTTEDTLKDMSAYIGKEVRSKEEDIDSNDEETKRQLMDQIVRVLSNFAGGMFKWVTLQLAIMFPIETQTFLPENIEIQLLDIENRNTSLEQSLNSAYETVYLINTKPGAYNTSVFKSVCKWLLCCRTALPADEVLRVIELSLDHDPKLQRITRSPLSTKVVLHCCSNFVIQSSEGNFRFAHLSVEEYLTNHCAVKSEFLYEECHLFVMKICLAFMAQEKNNSVAELVLKQGSKGFFMRCPAIKLKGVIFNFQTYSISYWAYHAKESIPERRCREPLYKSFVLGARLSPSLQWWFSQIDDYNYSGSMKNQIAEIAEKVLRNPPKRDQYPSESRLRMLGAAFNLPEILENGLSNCKEEVDASLRFGLTPLLVAIRHCSPDSVKCLLDLGANPTLISVTHRDRTRYGNFGRPIADEDMVYWATGRGGHRQRPVKGHLQIENVLLNHEKSRNHFLDQLERHLRADTHPDPSRALNILYRASNEVPISAKIFGYRMKARGLGELAQILDLIDEETFDEEMVASIVRHDSCETVKKFFEFKHVDSITEQMVRSALRSFDSNTVAYLMKRFGHDTLTREIVIDARPHLHEVWKVILDLKGIQFVDQEVFNSMFENRVDLKAVNFVLDTCGTEMMGSSHVELIAGSLSYNLEDLNAILRIRGSLDDLITEEAVFQAFQTEKFDMANFLLKNAEDPSSLLTKRVKDIAYLDGDAGMLILENFIKNTCD